MYINTPNTARGQVSEGYIISFKKVFSCFYFKKKKTVIRRLSDSFLHMLSSHRAAVRKSLLPQPSNHL